MRMRHGHANGSASAPHSAGPSSAPQAVSPITPDSASAAATLFPGQDPTLSLGNLYATDVDVTKAAAELAGMMPPATGGDAGPVGWDQFFPGAVDGGAGMALPDLNGPWNGGISGGMMGDECLAAMMGLGNETWFL